MRKSYGKRKAARPKEMFLHGLVLETGRYLNVAGFAIVSLAKRNWRIAKRAFDVFVGKTPLKI